jgi:hypothetical protein
MLMEEQIAKARWMTFCTDFEKTHHGYEARLEIIGRDFGDQEEAAWLPFSGISYDPHHDQVFVTVGGISSRYPVHLTHMVPAPTTIEKHTSPDGELRTLRISNADTTTLIHLRRQAQLTA